MQGEAVPAGGLCSELAPAETPTRWSPLVLQVSRDTETPGWEQKLGNRS